MNKLRNAFKFSCLASVFALGVANATNPCDGFEITIQNNLDKDLGVTTLKLSNGAKFEPRGINTISKNSQATFIVNNVVTDENLSAEISATLMDPRNLDFRNFRFRATLVKAGPLCDFQDNGQTGELKATTSSSLRRMTYTINPQ